MIRCWQDCILSVWQHYRDDSCRDAVLLNHQNRFVSRNTRVVQGEVSVWNLPRRAAAIVASSWSSKSVKYSAVTLEVTSRWQFLFSSVTFLLQLTSRETSPWTRVVVLVTKRSSLFHKVFSVGIFSVWRRQKRGLLKDETLTVGVAPKDHMTAAGSVDPADRFWNLWWVLNLNLNGGIPL